MTNEFFEDFTDLNKPVTKILLKNKASLVIAIKLASGVSLSDHKSPGPAKILVLKGAVRYRSENHNIILKPYEEFLIPLDDLHSVAGEENSILLLMINHEGY